MRTRTRLPSLASKEAPSSRPPGQSLQHSHKSSSLQASGGFPLLREAGKVPRSGGWGAESSYGSMQVCGDGRAIRLGPKQRATPHPAP